MLKKVLAVFPVFIFFVFSGLFVFASPSSPVVFSSGGSASTNLAAEKIAKIDQLWSGIKNEIKKPEYYFLTKISIEMSIRGGKLYDLGPLYKAAQTELATSGSSLETKGAREKLLELVDAGLDSAKVNFMLSHEKGYGVFISISVLWQAHIQELAKPKYAHLIRVPIIIKDSSYDFEPLFTAVQQNHDSDYKWYQLPTSAKDLLIELLTDQGFGDQALVSVASSHLASALTTTTLDLLWSEIKSELKTKYAHLSKTPITIEEKEYKLELLFAAAKDDTQYKKRGSELLVQAKNKLQELVNDIVTAQNVKDALDVKNNENLNTLWSGIRDELKKLEYAHLSKTPILVNGNNRNLEPLFIAVKNEYRVLGSQLSDRAKNKLQSLVSADVEHQIFKTSLTTANIQNNQKLDNFWTQLKKILKQPEFSKWKNISIKIKNKSYDLKPLFAIAKEKADVKGSAFSLDAKLKLQELLNDQVTSKMVENQLLALNQVEKEKENLLIGLATGGSVLFVAGVGGFLYWFFKIRK